ncbi:MAG TPA: ribonuclease HI family protein [Candidatus Paceibacterota bacterium]|nr:ribonuclease HI family protein [Candidatus Paceibacterota bacterium]HOL53920.1 ribonuclease HI family protein [Candidatus Paceibacterota bacterium]HON21588.1 ribonuclease HI family protein [Candidatus Paceibacterota bacterium]HOV88509.1 ribonuclease HI family protein [Candidatus Paceibacterota bacterium]HPP16810.1 ribonuclease HI family protein [Candidatus Paceibacterota bacterium]
MRKNISKKIIAYTDGGSRGNPGPAAIGVVIEGIGNEPKQYNEFIGEATNNEAEYQAVIFALKKIRQLAGREILKQIQVEIRLDSELVAKQLNGEYKIEEEKLQPLFMTVWNLKFDFGNLSFKHIPREENRLADRLVNMCLDQQNSQLF